MTRSGLTPPDPRSATMKAVLNVCTCFAISFHPLLLLGESGTGKSWLARQIHGMSSVRNGPWVETHAPELEALTASVLSGHEKGSFTGADRLHRGLLEEAANGSLFVDEIGAASRPLQKFLLTKVERTEIRRLGASRNIPVSVRFIFATNEPLEERIARRKFRADFFHRIKVLTVTLPPLRERREDIPDLAHYFLQSEAHDHGMPAPEIMTEAMDRLVHARWPGNLRELRMTMVRTLLLTRGQSVIRADDVELDTMPISLTSPARADLTFENVRRALTRSGGNRRRAAESLGYSERQLYRVISRMPDGTNPGQEAHEPA